MEEMERERANGNELKYKTRQIRETSCKIVSCKNCQKGF